MIAMNPQPMFDLGRLYATPAALRVIRESGQRLEEFLNRHIHGDWGQVFDEDWHRNDEAVETGGQILSVYRADNGAKIWVITEAVGPSGRRMQTTVVLPSEFKHERFRKSP
jgi:hypothetical protein